MRVAVPHFGSRVAPRCPYAGWATIADLVEGRIASKTKHDFDVPAEDELGDALQFLGVEAFVCGGLGRDAACDLEARGIRVIQNVAGEVEEVLGALQRGELHPGYGLHPERSAAENEILPGDDLPIVDCVACADRPCLVGDACPGHLGAGSGPWLRGEEARIYEAGRDVSTEPGPKLCRIAELVHFGLGAGYRRMGVAFCSELFREVETLVAVLGRFFEVVPVCCLALSGPNADVRPDGSHAAPCNPVLQARILAKARTDLNVIAGLCLGCDLLFTAHSRAPVTTLFVKDRQLAHNPVGAIYTRYHLDRLAKEPPAAAHGRYGRNP